MKKPLHLLCVLISGSLLPLQSSAHESFILWHDHHLHIHDHDHMGHDHDHGHEHHAHDYGHAHAEPKGGYKMELQADEEHRWAIGTGVRYTRLSWEGEEAHLWESGIGLSYRATPWLNLGAEVTYGWFDSHEGRSSGLMFPHFFADMHLPLARNWEAIVSLGAATPGGDEGLVGNHWEVAAGLALRYDRGRWFAEAGANMFFLYGDVHSHRPGDEHDDSHDDHEEHEDHEEDSHEEHHEEHGHEEEEHHGEENGHAEERRHAHEGGHGHAPGDYHAVVDPHGKREVHYYMNLGVRLWEERLTLEGRFHGVHVITRDTPERDYLRVGLRTTYQLNDNWAIRTEASIPITDARRSQWLTSLSVQVSF